MNARDKAHQISAAIVTTQNRLNYLEKELAWTQGNADEIKRLRRVLKALDRDLDQIVATIPAPVQFDFFASVSPASPPPTARETDPLIEKGKDDTTPRTIVRRSVRHYGSRG